uniref:Uncharacterized protein n=1 Tax=Anguilla anguilla TaxID=7936 RepID=A0A0E9PR16_ANGAN
MWRDLNRSQCLRDNLQESFFQQL